jgi:hypothetical protein
MCKTLFAEHLNGTGRVLIYQCCRYYHLHVRGFGVVRYQDL